MDSLGIQMLSPIEQKKLNLLTRAQLREVILLQQQKLSQMLRQERDQDELLEKAQSNGHAKHSSSTSRGKNGRVNRVVAI